MIAQVMGQITYILMGSTWGLSNKHEGTDTWQALKEQPSETYTTVFATAGQDAIALVAVLPYFTRRGNSKQ